MCYCLYVDMEAIFTWIELHLEENVQNKTFPICLRVPTNVYRHTNYFNVHPFKCMYSEITLFNPTQSHLTLHLIIAYMTFVGSSDLI